MLEAMSDSELLALHGECASDAESLRVLESYLDRRLGADCRKARARTKSAPPIGG